MILTNRQSQQDSGCCRQISLRLLQDGHEVEVHLVGDVLADDCLLLSSADAFACAQPAQLAVCFQQQSFQVAGEIRQCQPSGPEYVIHLFLHQPDKLQTRMLLQLAEIEQYRHYLQSQGREVSIDEAAEEWVRRYAEDFAAEFDAEH